MRRWRERLWLAAFLALLVALPPAVSGRLSLSIFLFIGLNGLIAIGLTLLGGHAGQISLGQAAFYGIGAYISAIATLRYGINPWVGMVLALAGAGLLAYLIGAPILILRGHYLVLGTLGFNVIVDVLLRNLQELTGGPSGLTGIPALSVAGRVLAGDRAFYALTWGAVMAALWLGNNLIRSRVGRALAAVRASEVAAATLGINPAHYKGRMFALSAALAALAGSLYVHYLSFVSPSPFAFEFSIVLLVMSVLGGIAHLPGAVLGAALLTVLREALRDILPRFFRAGASAEYEIIVFGLLLAVVVIFFPGGLWPFVQQVLGLAPPHDPGSPGFREQTRQTSAPTALPIVTGPNPVDASERTAGAGTGTAAADRRPLLSLDGLTKRFGGLIAVHELSLVVHGGEIYAIIGPNGAGKTTVFNLISAVLRPTRGEIRLDGRALTRLPAYDVAAAGIARTFQTPHIFGDLTAAENVMLGMHRHLRSGFLTSMLRLSESEERTARADAFGYLRQVGLEAAADVRAAGLPFGGQRLLEMARALAARPRLLLLDEPASGLSAAERRALVALIRTIREQGVTVLLVEHDVGLVMGLADRVLVLNYGERIAEGYPAAVRQDAAVIAAYLGEPA